MSNCFNSTTYHTRDQTCSGLDRGSKSGPALIMFGINLTIKPPVIKPADRHILPRPPPPMILIPDKVPHLISSKDWSTATDVTGRNTRDLRNPGPYLISIRVIIWPPWIKVDDHHICYLFAQ